MLSKFLIALVIILVTGATLFDGVDSFLSMPIVYRDHISKECLFIVDELRTHDCTQLPLIYREEYR